MPSPGSLLDPSELLEIQIRWVVYHIMCGYVACVSDCRRSVETTTIRHTDHIITHYMIYHPSDLIESRWGARFFAHVQTGSGAHPASCTMGTGSFPGVNRPRRGADHPPLLVPRLRMGRAIPLPPLQGHEACNRVNFTFYPSDLYFK
jgi:hypothetical protein